MLEQRLERGFDRHTEGEKGLRVLCSATLQAPATLFGQSQKRNSAKFVCRILHSRGPKVGCRAYHQMVKHTSQHYILWCWIKIRWGEWSNAFIVGSSAVAMMLDRDPRSYGHRLWKIASTTLSKSHLAKIGRGRSGCGTGRSSGRRQGSSGSNSSVP